MPTINVIPSWTIKKLSEDQKVAGTLLANGVYSIHFDRNGKDNEEVISIKDVKPILKNVDDPNSEVVDYLIIPSVEFWIDSFDSGENLGEDYNIKVSEITSIERVYIKYDAIDRTKRPKSVDEDPFVFNFINPKSNKPFKIIVDHDHFVGIPALTKKGDVHTNFGFINRVETNDSGAVTKVVMDSIISNRGVFRTSTTIIPYDKLRGIYHYEIGIIPHKMPFVNEAIETKTAEVPEDTKPQETTEEKTEKADIGCTPWGSDDAPATEAEPSTEGTM